MPDPPSRPTAAIDKAWQEGDIDGVERAMKAFAHADEIVSSARIENAFPHPVLVIMEPYAEELALAPGQAAYVFSCGPEPPSLKDRLHIQCSEQRIEVWLQFGCLGYIIAEPIVSP